MIVITGDRRDVVLQYVLPWLAKTDAELIFLDQFSLGSRWKPHKDGVEYDQYWLDQKDIKSIYSRIQPNASTSKLMDDWVFCLDEWPSLVINRPKDTLSNIAKAYQLELIELGPLKLIPYEVVAQDYHKVNKSWIYKSMSGIRSIVTSVEQDQEWVNEPILFQKRVQGINIRVHVIGEEIFSCEIHSQVVDYRYDQKRSMNVITLPQNISDACIRITQELGLLFSGIDLILSDGSYFILEVNPQPGFSFFSVVSEAIADCLMRKLCQDK
ncbi:MAG: ATP-grasp domain-containing protein [Candidatus Comchoanobacterales bacterium]